MTSSRRSGEVVVVGVGTSAEGCRRALRFAADEANRRRAEVRLVHGCEPTTGPATLEPLLPMDQRREQAKTLLVEATKLLWPDLDAGLKISTRVHDGVASAALLSESAGASMVVLERRDLPTVTRWLTGSTTSVVSAKASCPVAVVRSDQGVTAAARGVVVGVDDAGHARQALSTAFDAAALRHTSVTAVHGWRPDEALLAYGYGLPTPDDLEQLRQREAILLSEALAGFAADYPDVPVAQQVVDGPAVEVLLEAAAKAELLVVGRHGSGHLGSLALGTVARHCLGSAPCPVVVTPTSRPLRRDRRAPVGVGAPSSP